jgi:hypothetical protein
MSNSPTVLRIQPRGVFAGRAVWEAIVKYPASVSVEQTQFVGPRTGYGPVALVTTSGLQTLVTDPHRFGPFGREWVTRFYA